MRRSRWSRRGRLSAFSVCRSSESLEIRNLLSATMSTGSSHRDVAPPDVPVLDHVPNELLVQFSPGTSAQMATTVAESFGMSVRSTIYTAAMRASGQGLMLRVGTPDGTDLNQAIQRLELNPKVQFAELNYLYQPSYVSNDQYYTDGTLWGMYSADNPVAGPAGTTNQYGIGAEQAWRDGFIGSSSVVIGVIDTGVQISHPDLADNIWINPYETAGDGLDNDGNGYIDDVNGWDFYNNDNSVYDSTADDHGTHVSGTIAGAGNNTVGVAGVNWRASIIPLKFLGAGGGTTADAVLAVDYLTDMKSRHGMNIVASNNSWGGGGYSQALHDALIRHAKADILFVAAAGNSTTNNDATANYPSNYNTTIGTPSESAASFDGVIAVASITDTGGISWFSSYGATTVDIGAPGSSIMSSVPFSSYALFDGTSMATPHVTGAVGLFASVQSGTPSALAIKNAILNTAVATPSLSGKVATGGRLNVYNAIRSSNFVYLDREQYGATGLVTVTVSHAGANVNAGSADTVTVSMSSQTESGVTITLTETGANTGIFNGTIQLAPGAAASDALLQVSVPDLITATYTTLGLTDTAIVDGTPPVISNITATPLSTSATITWNTDKLATSEVVYGTNPLSMTSTASTAGVHLSHSVTLTGLSPNTPYFYRVVTTDESGNQAVSSIQAFATLSLPQILLVDDDQGDVLEQYFMNALNANSLAYDVWDAFALGTTPDAADLAPYGMVIWNTGFDYVSATSGITPIEETAISGYLDGGGRIFVSGEDILYNGVSTTFQQNYLKVASFSNDILTSAHVQTGVTGHPIGDNLVLQISVPPEFGVLFVDAVAPMTGAEGFLQHGITGVDPYSAVSYHGDYSAGEFGMVFSTVPFESISATDASPNNSAEVMRRIVEFLLGPLPGTVDIERPAYNPNDQVLLTVTDTAANLDDLTAETVDVIVYSITELTPITVTLVETGPATGVFEAYVQLSSGPAVANDGVLSVVHDDFIIADYAGGSSIDFARVDAVAPTASNVVAAAYPTRATITWDTDEDSFEVILLGTSPTDLSMQYFGAGFSQSHLMTISGLTPNTEYFYQIVSIDMAGNFSLSPIDSFITTPAQPILVIDDDGGASLEQFFIDALSANSFTSDAWDLQASASTPLAEDLMHYRMVVWNAGSGSLSPEAQAAIQQYLNAGGRIYISGQDVLLYGVDPTFRQNYLKVASWEDDVQTAAHNEVGVTNNPISNGMSIPVAPTGQVPALWVDAVTPGPGATGFLRHGVTSASSSFSSVSYRGNYASGGFGVVFSTVPFEAMSTTASSPNNQAAFMFRVVDYLIGPLPAIVVSTPSATTTAEAGTQVTFTVVLNSQPTAWVYVPVGISDSTEGSTSTTLVAFSTANWFVPQTVTISGVNDFVDDGDIAYSVLIGPSSSPDVLYNAIDSADIGLVNTDDDTAGITVGSPSGTTTTEIGGSITFVVRLDSEPLSPVTLALGSSDSTEGSLSASSLTFDATNWFINQVVTVTGVDDLVHDGDIDYTITIGPSASSDPLYNGINPADIALVNIDNDPADSKFYVVNDSTVDRTYEYDPSGNPVENYAINSTNTAPRGIATTAAGTRYWVLDANRKVYVYDNAGGLLGSWTLGTVTSTALVEGIATNGTHLWVVDRTGRRVYYYANAASRLSGTQAATNSFALNAANTNPKDLVFGSQSGQNMLWVVDDGTASDRVYRYILTGAGISTVNTAWSISPENSSPTGITLDPGNGSMDIWIVDSGKDRVYRYPNGRTSVIPLMSDSFALLGGNSNAQGIADPPPSGESSVPPEQWSDEWTVSSYDPIPTVSRRLQMFSGNEQNFDSLSVRNRITALPGNGSPSSLSPSKSAAKVARKEISRLNTVRESAIQPISLTGSDSSLLETMDALFANLTAHGDLLN